MDLLPEECIDIIVSYLDVVSLTWLGLSSKRLRGSCFSPRYWTHVDFANISGNNITNESILKLSSFATSLQILNIQNCPNVNLESLVPLVFSFKELELIKHDGEHRLLDETVAINRMLKKADQLLKKYKLDDKIQEHGIVGRQKYDNAVRQARALIWDAMLIVVANKRGKDFLQNYFQNIHHHQDTLDRVTKMLRETEKMLDQPLKLWHNTLTWKSAIRSVAFVTDPRSNKIYLACGVSGEIVLWDMDTRTVFKVFNYLDSLEQLTAKNIKRRRDFISVFMFSHLDRVMIFGGTPQGAVCWDFDTCQIVYEVKLPHEEPVDNGYRRRYYARNWAMNDKNEGIVEVYGGMFLFDAVTGQLGTLMKFPKNDQSKMRAIKTIVHSSKHNSLVLKSWRQNEEDLIVTIIDLEIQQEKQILKLVPSPYKDYYDEVAVDWYNERLIALQASRGVEIYKNQSDTDHQYELHITIDRPKKVEKVKFLSEKLLLIDQDIYDVDTGKIEISVEIRIRNNLIVYHPELNIIIHAHDVGIAAIYDMKTKQKIGPDPCVTPLCAFSKLDNKTVLLHGNFSTLASYVNYHGRNYAKLSLNGCKLIETIDTPLQILDVSADGKYALAQEVCYPLKSRQDVTFRVLELATKQVIFQRNFLQGYDSAAWSIFPVGQFMPQHSDQVLLSHPKSGFQIFDVTSGKLLRDYSTDDYGKVGSHIKISTDERFVVFKSINKSKLVCVVVVDLEQNKAYDIKAHSNSSDSIAFNPTNSCQLVIAGYGIGVFNLPNTQRELFFTRHLDGLVEPIRESEEVVCLKFSPDGKYLAAIDPPSRGPWGLEIANTLIRVYETTTFTQVSSFDTGGHARALYWLDNERALIGMINGELMTLQLVVEEYKSLFNYIVPSKVPKIKSK